MPEEVRRAANLLERRWTLSILWASAAGAVRFNELKQAVGEIPQVLAEYDRRDVGRNRCERHRPSVERRRDALDASVPERAAREVVQRADGRVPVDAHDLATARDLHLPRVDLGEGRGCELRQLLLLQVGVPPAALDPCGEPQVLEELRQLQRRGVDHLQVANCLLRLAAHPQERPGEAVHRRERRPQVVDGERHEAREVGVPLGHR